MDAASSGYMVRNKNLNGVGQWWVMAVMPFYNVAQWKRYPEVMMR